MLACAKAKFPYSVIIELQPLTFTHYSHYFELFISAAAFYAVGWQKKLDLFKLALFDSCQRSCLPYHARRVVHLPLCRGVHRRLPLSNTASESGQEWTIDWREFAGISAGMVLALILAAPVADFNTRGLDRPVSNDFPVKAINYLRHNPVPGPLYNNLNWAGS